MTSVSRALGGFRHGVDDEIRQRQFVLDDMRKPGTVMFGGMNLNLHCRPFRAIDCNLFLLMQSIAHCQ